MEWWVHWDGSHFASPKSDICHNHKTSWILWVKINPYNNTVSNIGSTKIEIQIQKEPVAQNLLLTKCLMP